MGSDEEDDEDNAKDDEEDDEDNAKDDEDSVSISQNAIYLYNI